MSVPRRVLDRVEDYKNTGRAFLSLLQKANVKLDLYHGVDIVSQIVSLNMPVGAGRVFPNSLCRAAGALLLTDFPIQCPLTSHEILQVARLSYDPLPASLAPKLKTTDYIKNISYLKQYFPIKKHSAASTKVNVYAIQMLESMMQRGYQAGADVILRSLAGRASDDQLTMALLYAVALVPRIGAEAYTIAAQVVLSPVAAKGFSTALKALGANSDMLGSQLCEGDILQGRATGDCDLFADAHARCFPSPENDMVLKVDEDHLRRTIREILVQELGDAPIDFEGVEEHWRTRWRWCVNGSHSSLLSRYGDLNDPQMKVAFAGATKIYRRMYAELRGDDPVTGWDGTTYVSGSQKLELGKTRGIFACDTRSYFAFEHLLAPVEAKWKNKEVILNPGLYGDFGLAQQVLKLRGSGGVSVMLDYDSFNEQHALSTQKILFEELARYTGYPDDLLSTLVASFDKMKMYVNGKYVGTAAGTLMSGHRGTSFVNTVMNAAYVKMACGPDLYNRIGKMHVGDDVYLATQTYSDAALVLERTTSFGCRMNPSKQSVGTVGAEFLRTAIRSTHCTGYLTRSIGSVVSGNWVGQKKLSPIEAIQSAVTTCRSLINRSQNSIFPALLCRALSRATQVPTKLCRNLLAGTVALEGAPVFFSNGVITNYRYVPPPPRADLNKTEAQLRAWPQHATTDYLTYGVQPIEREALGMTGHSVRTAMLVASYNKALADTTLSTPKPRFVRHTDSTPLGSASAYTLTKSREVYGCLSKYPILQLMKSVFTTEDLRYLVKVEGGRHTAPDIRQEAWGAETVSSVVDGFMSYADASSCSKKTLAGVIFCTYPTYK